MCYISACVYKVRPSRVDSVLLEIKLCNVLGKLKSCLLFQHRKQTECWCWCRTKEKSVNLQRPNPSRDLTCPVFRPRGRLRRSPVVSWSRYS